jgi:4-carboxymuconolactone decarboxylase
MKKILPANVRRFEKSYRGIWRAFEQLGQECHKAGPLDARTRRLVKIGIAAAAGSEGAMHSAVRHARAEGVSAAEIRHAILLTITTIGFPRAQAALTWAQDVLRKK